MPFLAAAVVNIEAVTFGLQPSYLFGLFWIVHVLFMYCRKVPVIGKMQKRMLVACSVLWLVALVSFNMTNIFRNEILVHGPSDLWGFKPLEFSRTNLTQFMYLSFVILVSLLTMLEAKSVKVFTYAVKAMLYSLTFSVFWGGYQMFCFYTGREYPYYLFNNNMGFAQLWNQSADGIVRVSSICTEPAAFSSVLLMTLPMLIVVWVNRVHVIHPAHLILLMGSTFSMILLTTSTTAYVGFLFMTALLMVVMISRRKCSVMNNTYKQAALLGVIFFVSFGVFVFIAFRMNFDRMLALLSSATVGKFASASGMERKEGFIKGLEIFLQSRMLGVGWGSNRTFDLSSTLLSTIGIHGFLLVVYILFSAVKQCLTTYLSTKDKDFHWIGASFFLSVGTLVFITFISGPDMASLPLWIMLGLAMALPGGSTERVENGRGKTASG